MTETKTEDSSRNRKLEAFKEFIDEFSEETDRAAVIVGAAKLDLLMYQILQRFLLPVPGGNDALFDGDSPLSTLSSKINILHRLGIISAEFARLLHLVRKIRNDFAHETTGCDLGSGAHRNRVRELVAPMVESVLFTGIQNKYFSDTRGSSADFRTALAILVGRLEGEFSRTKPLSLSPTNVLPSEQSKKKELGEPI